MSRTISRPAELYSVCNTKRATSLSLSSRAFSKASEAFVVIDPNALNAVNNIMIVRYFPDKIQRFLYLFLFPFRQRRFRLLQGLLVY